MCLSSPSACASHFGEIPCVVVCLFYFSMSSVRIETTVFFGNFTPVYLEPVQFERMNKFVLYSFIPNAYFIPKYVLIVGPQQWKDTVLCL